VTNKNHQNIFKEQTTDFNSRWRCGVP